MFNSAPEVHAPLDFLEAHLYPDDDGQEALDLATAVAQSAAKPLIAGETFSFGAVRHLIATTCRAGTVQGWIGQYDNRVLGGPCSNPSPYGCAFFDAWYQIQRDFGPALRAGECPPAQ